MEQSFVAWAKMRARRLPQCKLGIGDDAAVLQADANDLVVTTDSLMDGTHFEMDHVELNRIGHKLVAVNLSDLAAMAAEPEALLLSLCVPTNHAQPADVIASEIYEGVCQAAERYNVALAGGDTNCWDGPLCLHLTAIGRSKGGLVWTRNGAKPDDLVVVTGPLGGSILGKHLDFEPRVELAQRIASELSVHAAMDISDGLSVDLLRMCDASQCGAVLELDQVPVSEQAEQLAQSSGKSGVQHALSDGEDFELLLAIAPADYGRLVELVGPEYAIRCGVFTSRTGLWSRDGAKIRQMTSSGYIHGSESEE